MIGWHEDLAIGAPATDQDHRRLVERLLGAQAAYAEGDVRSAARLLRQFLAEFSRHFDREQRSLTAVGCPAVAERGSEYRTSHALFSVHPLEADDVEVIGQMIEYATAWLVDHIIRQDMPLRRWFADRPSAHQREGFRFRFDLIKLRWRIALLALVPLAALAGLVAASVWELERNAESMRLMARMNHLNGQVADLIHEMQHERGLATLILSDRRLGRDAIELQYARTDEAMARYREAATKIQNDLPDGPARERLSNALYSIELIKEARGDLIGGSFDAVETMDFYSTAVEDLVDVVPDVVRAVLPSDFAKLTFAQIFLQQAKERAGRERSAGVAILSQAATPDAVQQSVRDLAAEHRALGAGFLSLAPDDLAAAYRAADKVAAGPMIWMRNALESGDLREISAQEWFDATTQRIDALREVETEVAARLTAEAARLERATWHRLLLLASGMAVLVVVCLAMVLGLGWSILPPLAQLSGAVRRLAGGDRLVAIPGLASRDELGSFAAAVQQLKERLVHGDLLEARRLTANVERLRVVADNMPGVVFRVHQPESGPALVACASRKLREVIGLAASDMVDRPLRRVIRELCRPSDWAGLLLALKRAGHRPVNLEFQMRDGPLAGGRWLRVLASPSPTEDGWVWDGVALDVTTVKAAEEERARVAGELARIRQGQTAAELAAGIGKDLSAALLPLLTHAENAAQRVPEGSPGREEVVAIASNTRRLRHLVEQLLPAPADRTEPPTGGGAGAGSGNVVPFVGRRS
ncbi:MAG: nitrate- and nitrite sensing domain-containing protein [Solirubrobacterales bacterium]